MAPRFVAVIDIGKTNAKLALVDLARSTELAVRKAPNPVLPGPPYPHFDVEALWRFILEGLAALNREQPVDAVTVTTHGAAAALVGADGRLVLPVLDYEYDGPDALGAAYDAVRPPFAETGSPRLPLGLNLGAQLFWQERTFPEAFAAAASIVPYPQYWALRLTGIAASETTSLGCHTDLWNPAAGAPSSLVDTRGWGEKLAPIVPAGDVLGPLLPDIAARTGLAPATPVHAGIHDSNASLVPHLLARTPPFAVVSTGTWVIAMAIGVPAGTLDPQRDTLINVDAFGRPVPSARFMGGREYAVLTEGLDGTEPSRADIDAVLEGLLLLPSVQQGSGPFPAAKARWSGDVSPEGGRRAAAVAFYLAMMTVTCLDLIGARGPTVVEGPFASNAPFCRMLAAATGRAVIAEAGGGTGTSIGAALLTAPATPVTAPGDACFDPPGPAWTAYAQAWRDAVDRPG